MTAQCPVLCLQSGAEGESLHDTHAERSFPSQEGTDRDTSLWIDFLTFRSQEQHFLEMHIQISKQHHGLKCLLEGLEKLQQPSAGSGMGWRGWVGQEPRHL